MLALKYHKSIVIGKLMVFFKTISNSKLRLCEEIFQNMINAVLVPDSLSYEYLIASWINSSHNNKIQEAYNIFQYMLDIGLIPSIQLSCKMIRLCSEYDFIEQAEKKYENVLDLYIASILYYYAQTNNNNNNSIIKYYEKANEILKLILFINDNNNY